MLTPSGILWRGCGCVSCWPSTDRSALRSIASIDQSNVAQEKLSASRLFKSDDFLGATSMRYSCPRFLVIVLALLVVTSSSGKSSKLVMSWKNPAYTGTNKFHRLLALGLSDKTVIRADFEDELASELGAPKREAIPGNAILLRPEGTQFDLDYLKTQIREHGIDAVVVSRLINVEITSTYVPGAPYVPPFPYYNSFYGYYGAVYPAVYGPGYLKEEKKVRIETNLYAISSTEGELVWTCITDSFNPSADEKTIQQLVKVVAGQMKSQGIL